MGHSHGLQPWAAIAMLVPGRVHGSELEMGMARNTHKSPVPSRDTHQLETLSEFRKCTVGGIGKGLRELLGIGKAGPPCATGCNARTAPTSAGLAAAAAPWAAALTPRRWAPPFPPPLAHCCTGAPKDIVSTCSV